MTRNKIVRIEAGTGQFGISLFHGCTIQVMHDNGASKGLTKGRSTTYMIDVAVGEEHCRQRRGGEPQVLDILTKGMDVRVDARVNQYQGALTINEVYHAIARARKARSADKIDVGSNTTWVPHAPF